MLPFHNPEVALHFIDSDFDEVVEDSLWLLGRQENNYVAVRRNCIGEINGVRACEMNRGQSWVIVAGDSALHGGFNNFQNIIHQAQFTEQWQDADSVYFAKIAVDNQSIEYIWRAESVSTGESSATSFNPEFNIYPNPASNRITIDLSGFMDQPVAIGLKNMLGQDVYAEKILYHESHHAISTVGLQAGVYFLTIETLKGTYTQKVMKN